MLCISATEHYCDVQPFSPSYKPIEKVPIVTACTAYDDPLSGNTTILIFHQALWFGNQLEGSLICPNQVRSHGISFCDDPYDPHRPLGITTSDNDQHITFDVTNGMVGILTRVPTWEEYQTLPHIVMTSDSPWEPHSPNLPHHQKKHIHAITRAKQALNNNNKILQMDHFEHCLATCSAALTKTLYPRLINAVAIRSTKAITSTERHATITPDALARRWHIGLDTA